MQILRISQNLYPEQKGGGSYHVHAMSRDQVAMGHRVTVMTTRSDSSLPKEEHRSGYKIIRFDTQVSPLGNDISVGLARYLLQASKFDIIHAHSHLFFSTNLAAFKRQVGDIPLAITNHGLFSQTAPMNVQKLYLRTLGKWTFNRADLLFCYTDGVKQRFRSRGITSPIQVVSNGIDHARFTPEGSHSDIIDDNRPTVLSVIRLVEGKRPLDAIKSIDRLRESFPRIHLYIAGDGHLKNDLQEYINKNRLKNTVTLLGNVDYDEMPKLYRSCDVLLLPSKEEAGAPRVVLEAMATRTPFVLTELEHTSDILLETGINVPVGKIDAISSELGRLLADNELQIKIGTKGEKLVRQEFNWKGTVEDTTEALDRLIHKKGYRAI